MQTWEYRTVIASKAALDELQEKPWADDTLGDLVDLDRQGETTIGKGLRILGSKGWELATAVLVQPVEEYPSPELLLIFKCPKE